MATNSKALKVRLIVRVDSFISSAKLTPIAGKNGQLQLRARDRVTVTCGLSAAYETAACRAQAARSRHSKAASLLVAALGDSRQMRYALET